MISDKTDDITASRQFNQAIKKLHRYWRTDRARWMSAQTNWMNIKCAISIVIISDVSQRIKRTHISITISGTDIQHSSRRADAAGALLLVVLLQGFLGLPCLHLLLSADD